MFDISGFSDEERRALMAQLREAGVEDIDEEPEFELEPADDSDAEDEDDGIDEGLEEIPVEDTKPTETKKDADDEEVVLPKSVLTTWQPDTSQLWRMMHHPEIRATQRIKHPETGELERHHPRYDDALYEFLDDDERLLEEHRFEFGEALTNKQFRGMLKESGYWGSVMSRVFMGTIISVVLGVIWWIFSGWFEPTGSIVDVVLGMIAGIPLFMMIPIVLIVPAMMYYWGMSNAFNNLMALVYIIDGHKRIVLCRYPNYLMAGRGDQLTTGEYVLSLEACCKDPYCEHPLRNLYERDLEKGLKSAATTGVTNAKEKYEIIRRIALVAKHAPTVPFNPAERAAKMLPFVLITIGCLVGAFLLFNSGGGG